MQPEKTTPLDVRLLFPVPIMITSIEDCAGLNAELKAIIEKKQAESEGVKRSNILGWHSDSQMLNWGGDAARRLGLTMLATCGSRTVDVGMKGGQPRFQMGLDMWANVSPAGASNQMHSHPGCIWSGVYYVDDGGDNSSALVLLDSNYPTNRMYAPDLQFVGLNGERYPVREEITPEAGKMVIFPSWLNHAVKPHAGDRPRISIAMNVTAFQTPQQPGAAGAPAQQP